MDTGRELRGGQRQVLLLMEGLRAAGVEGALLARAGSPLFAAAEQAKLAVRPVSLAGLVFARKANLVHVHDARAHTLAAVGTRVPFVVSRRVAFPVRRTVLSGWKYARARRFLAVSQFVAGELLSAGIAGDKIDVVYDGVQGDVTPAVWSAGASVVALDSDDPAKGRDLVASAARLADCPVVYSSNLTKDLLSASVFLYITRAEGLGSAALLAMAMGVPVIASKVGGLPEVLGNGRAGVLVENDPLPIAEAIQRVREDSALARTLIERGKERVAELFTAQQMVDNTMACYRRALGV